MQRQHAFVLNLSIYIFLIDSFFKKKTNKIEYFLFKVRIAREELEKMSNDDFLKW